MNDRVLKQLLNGFSEQSNLKTKPRKHFRGLTISLINILGKLVQGFMSYDRIYKLTNRDYHLYTCKDNLFRHLKILPTL